jgi:glutamate formiminotransferase/formiminotetrahydrofolate cyclodeaminase
VGRDPFVIERIAAAVASVAGVRLLGVEPGHDTNRTVMTFVGPPEDVLEAAFRSARVASELIDMREHQGAHPRFGALDVCPLVPLLGCSFEEAVRWSRELGARLGNELGLTVFLYEQSASVPGRRDLAKVRAGQYEGLAARLLDPAWKPDFGPDSFNSRSGATALGARELLVAFNVSLTTEDAGVAYEIASVVRERGGGLPGVKAIGWYLPEYQAAQVSMNVTRLALTPLHAAFAEVLSLAEDMAVGVKGSEVVGLAPFESIEKAGGFEALGLGRIRPFDPKQKILELAIERAFG